MSRLIDADALRAQMYHEAFETDTDMQRWDGGCWIRYKMFENAIDNAPTIEPQKMRGKWVDGHRMRFDGTFHWYRMCSECGYERDDDNIDMDTNFCPDCGAEMEGAEE